MTEGWQTIDTAPHDSPVDLWVVRAGDAYRIADAEWRDGGWAYPNTLNCGCRESFEPLEPDEQPTHWMKAPAGPS